MDEADNREGDVEGAGACLGLRVGVADWEVLGVLEEGE